MTSQNTGGPSNRASRVRRLYAKNADSAPRRPRSTSAGAVLMAALRGGTTRPRSALDLLPLAGPRRVVGAVVARPVDALRLRRRPVVDLLGVGRVERVVGRAEALVGRVVAGLGLGRRLAEVLGDLGVNGR